MKTAITVLAILIAVVAYADELQRTSDPCRQTVIVPGKAFVREGWPGGRWGQWQEDFLPPRFARSWRYQADEWPRPIDQQVVRRAMGERNWEWFQRNPRVYQSGWFNLSGDRGWDWKQYNGQHFP